MADFTRYHLKIYLYLYFILTFNSPNAIIVIEKV